MISFLLETTLAVGFFIAVVFFFIAIILTTRKFLVASGNINITVNEKNCFSTPIGGKLMSSLAQEGIFVSSACGGGGTCGQCRVKVLSGGGSILPTETSHINKREAKDGYRLSCQLAVKRNLKIEIDASIFGIRKWRCLVRSNNNVATFIKNLVLDLPEGEEVDFRAGGFIQIECPPFSAKFSDFDVNQEYHDDWGRFSFWGCSASTSESVMRAYSMANYPKEKGIIMLNVRIATPPSPNIQGGIVSSYIFNLKPRDTVTIAGPFGEFFAKDTQNEMVFVGGGAGMAPMRSHILDQLKRLHTRRKISFWYGARSLRETFFVEDFDELAKTHKNFAWHIALSDPLKEDNWQGYRGFIHQILYDNYLKDHEAPEDCEYYICGPPMMLSAVFKMLDGLGVDKDNVLFDDFG